MSDQFRDFAAELGYELPHNIEPGRRFRFSTNGARSDDAGWGLLFPDGLGGVLGDWRTGDQQVWQAKRDRQFSPEERRSWFEKIEREKKEAQAQRQKEANDAAGRAQEIWSSGKPAPADHGYLKLKGINAYGLKVHSGTLVIRDMNCDGALILPLRDSAGAVRTLEFIRADGEKRFLPFGDPRGCYYAIGRPGDTLAVTEGFATGASIHKATGLPVRIAATAGNLLDVAKAIREKAPQAKLIICADNDRRTVCQRHKAEGVKEAVSPLSERPEWCRCNPGVTAALEAARAVGGTLAVPKVKEGTDYNDLDKQEGGAAVKEQIESAQAAKEVVSVVSVPEGADSGGWNQPLPLPDGLPPVDPFDFALLPDSLRGWAEDICERVQCPPDYVGVTIMAGLGALLGRKVGVRPQEKTDWTEFPNQWALLVGRPGVLKSPAMEAALSPLKLLTVQASEAHTRAMEEHEHKARIKKLQAEASEKAARAKLAKSPLADISNDLVTEDEEAPHLRRYIANDTSYQALGDLLRHNPNGVLVYRDELVSLLKGLDREDSAEARGFYLTGWNGNSAYTFDRIGRGSNLHIPAVCLSMLGSSQPGKVAEYLRTAVKGGTGDDGLIQRFGLLVWPDTGRVWKDVDRWPDNDARKRANAIYKRLDDLDPLTIGAERIENEDVPFLRFGPEALVLFRDWRTTLEARLREGALHPAMESHLAKYRKMVPGLALVLHLADEGYGAITEGAVLRALAWAQYLESHAKRAYASVVSPEVSAAKAIIAKLRSKELPATFAARDIYRAGWANLSERDQVLDALQLLADLDWVYFDLKDTGGRKATVYHANPRGL